MTHTSHILLLRLHLMVKFNPPSAVQSAHLSTHHTWFLGYASPGVYDYNIIGCKSP